MSKNPKMVMCRNCNTPMAANEKRCPMCGTKNRKPFFQRGWFIVLAIIVVIAVIGSVGGGGNNKGEKFDWADIRLGSMLPQPESNRGDIHTNSADKLWIDILRISETQYNDYIDACREQGFSVDSESMGIGYSAFNEDGYELSLSYDRRKEQMSIWLEPPMEMDTLQWPASDVAMLLPVPASDTGRISKDNSNGFAVYVGQTTRQAYGAYVDACAEYGFTVDYSRGDTYYRADNADGYHISLSYEGGNVMLIQIDAPKDTSVDERTEAGEEGSDFEQPDEKDEADEPEENGANELVDGMRPEFKEAMDSYEDFFNEYAEFMEKFAGSENTASMLVDYAKFMAQYAETMEAMDALGEQEMNDAELSYYAVVSARITQRLLEAAQ